MLKFWRTRVAIASATLGVFLIALIALSYAPQAHAIQTIPYKLNFQGRLLNSSGMPMADGTYNMTFRIFSGSSCSTGCTSAWTETRLVSASQGVAVTSGLFSVQLGDITALSPTLFSTPDLFFEVELPTPATATTTTPSWTEGAMTPRNKVGSAAYAFNADTLDGIDGSAFAQLSASNTWTGSNTFTGTTQSIQNTTNGTTAFTVKDQAGSALLTVNTADTTTLAATGVTFTSNGILYSANARPSRLVTLSPEYPGATFTPDGTNNNGSLSSDFCSGGARMNINPAVCGGAAGTATQNYYQWTTSQASVQDYDVYVRYQIPSDYDATNADGGISNLKVWGWGTTTANESVTVALFTDASGTACSTSSNAVTAAGTWVQATIASPKGSCTINPGDMVTFRVRLIAGTNNFARAGNISFGYRSIK